MEGKTVGVGLPNADDLTIGANDNTVRGTTGQEKNIGVGKALKGIYTHETTTHGGGCAADAPLRTESAEQKCKE